MLHRLSVNGWLSFFLISGGMIQYFPINYDEHCRIFTICTCTIIDTLSWKGLQSPKTGKGGWGDSYCPGLSCNRDFMDWGKIKRLLLGSDGQWGCWKVRGEKASSQRRRQGLGVLSSIPGLSLQKTVGRRSSTGHRIQDDNESHGSTPDFCLSQIQNVSCLCSVIDNR